MPIDPKTLEEIALTPAEYDLICQRLGREPTPVELGMFGGLWSEHCGYKHSKPLFGYFPTRSRRVLVPLGEENAGVVDIGDGLAVVFKVESHNHPSAIEPFQGAATGVGGIVRDIFALGARPIALLNSLRFGPLTEARNRYLLGGVVGGISSYGNCLGIPDVGGEVYFDSSYSGNCLVNCMCVGLIEAGRLVSQSAKNAGDLLMLVGADTGRDGIHGVSGLASRTFEAERELRPTVQVGNPFLEKLLIEACLELVGSGWVSAVQDLGGAGLTSSVVESAAKGGSGVEIDIQRVPRREAGMTPYEVMLSESQERMLVMVKPQFEAEVRAVFDKWGLHADVIGRVTADGLVRIRDGDAVVAEAPATLLTDPPMYRLQGQKPAYLDALQSRDLSSLPDRASSETLLRLLAAPNIASKSWIYRQYDHSVQANTVISPGDGDAAVLRIKGTTRGIAVCNDGNGRQCYLDPYIGGALAVAEAARNVVCVGAEPVALTDCLNFGNPERPEVYYQMEEALRGMGDACRALGVVVVSGNASLYNETAGVAIYPTPVVGMLGVLEDIERRCRTGFRDAGDAVALLGGNGAWNAAEATLSLDGDAADLGASEYLEVAHGLVAGRPRLDLDLEARVQRATLEAIRAGIVKSAHDCADGGLAVAVAECCIQGDVGFVSHRLAIAGRADAALFGEAASRVVVSVAPADMPALAKIAARHNAPLLPLGAVGGDRIRFGDVTDVPLAEADAAWRTGLERALR